MLNKNNIYYLLYGLKELCQNESTYHDTYYELIYFELITSKVPYNVVFTSHVNAKSCYIHFIVHSVNIFFKKNTFRKHNFIILTKIMFSKYDFNPHSSSMCTVKMQ